MGFICPSLLQAIGAPARAWERELALMSSQLLLLLSFKPPLLPPLAFPLLFMVSRREVQFPAPAPRCVLLGF